MKTVGILRAIVFTTFAVGTAACGMDGAPSSGSGGEDEVAQGLGVVAVDGEQYPVSDLETSSSLGNAHNFYTAIVHFETALLVLDFASPNVPGSLSIPLESEELEFPVGDPSQSSITAVYGRLCLPNCLQAETVVDLLSSVQGGLWVSGGAEAVQLDQVELTFPEIELSTEAYTDTSPKVQIALPTLSFPPL